MVTTTNGDTGTILDCQCKLANFSCGKLQREPLFCLNFYILIIVRRFVLCMNTSIIFYCVI